MDTTQKPGLARRILAFPLVWAVIGAAFIVIGDGVLVGIGSELGDTMSLTFSLIGAAFTLGVYVLVMKLLARRTVRELYRGILPNTLLGLVVGTGFIVVSIGIVAALGGYTITWHPVDVGHTLTMAIGINLATAIVEETLFRGILFQAADAFGGPWVAIAVTALLFGFAHLFNPGADLWSSVCIAIEAGVLMGAAFAWRRSIPFVVAIHFAWNTLEGLAGIPVSGHREPGLLSTEVHGPALLTGGAFGVEASLVPVLLSLVLSAGMLVLAGRAGRLRRAARPASDGLLA
jgi:uncharacterized protein